MLKMVLSIKIVPGVKPNRDIKEFYEVFDADVIMMMEHPQPRANQTHCQITSLSLLAALRKGILRWDISTYFLVINSTLFIFR